MAFRATEVLNEVEIDESVDTHDHLRDTAENGDGRMEMSTPLAVGQHESIFSIGNNAQAVLDQQGVDAHIAKAYGCIRGDERRIRIYGIPLMTDLTTPQMVVEGRTWADRTLIAWKIFMFGASNDAGKSVTDFAKIDEAVSMTYSPTINAANVPIHIHTEEKFDADGNRIPILEREHYAMVHKVTPFIRRHRRGVFVIKHVSDLRTLALIRQLRDEGFEVYAEVAAHYLCRCNDDLFEDGKGGTAFQANDLCWPIYKGYDSQMALREAILDPEDWIMFGSDRAMHIDNPTKDKGVKITDQGVVCGGTTIFPSVSKSIVIDCFEGVGRMEHLDAYLSTNARRVHGLPPAAKKVRYVRDPWEVPMTIEGRDKDGNTIRALPFMRGQKVNWKLAE